MAEPSNFSDYIDVKKFAIKPHSSTAPTFGYENAKPFHRVTDSSDKFLENTFKHKAPTPVVGQKPLPQSIDLGNITSHHTKLLSDPFGILSSSFPSFSRSWQPKHIEQAYSSAIVGKTPETIQHDLKISHARDPSNGGEPLSGTQSFEDRHEWAHKILDELAVEGLPNSVRMNETRKRDNVRNKKFAPAPGPVPGPVPGPAPAPGPGPAPNVPVLPASSLLGVGSSSTTSSTKSGNLKDSGAIVTSLKTNNPDEVVLIKRTKKTTPLPTDTYKTLTTIYSFTSNKNMEKEIRGLENKEATLQAKIDKRQMDGYSEEVVAKHFEKLTLLQEEIVNKKLVLKEKRAEQEIQDAKRNEAIHPDDQKLYQFVELELEGVQVVSKTMIDDVNKELTKQNHSEISRNIKKPESLLSAVWAAIGHSTGIKTKSPVKKSLAKSTESYPEIEEDLVKGREPTGKILNDKRLNYQFGR